MKKCPKCGIAISDAMDECVSCHTKVISNEVVNVASIDLLKPNGRLCIITFHSLEDRAVKNAMVDMQGKCTCPKELPYCICNKKFEFASS